MKRRKQLERLRKTLKPFAAEGRKWLATRPVHDDLKLLIAEDYMLMHHHGREATFTIGDLKRAARLLGQLK